LTLYPEIEPYACGMLEAGQGHQVYWEACGNPSGKPALVLHGGPGSGCTPWHRRLFDPAAYRVVLFDQRGCGRSLPHGGEPVADLAANTTPELLADVELLRESLGIERWLVLGGSWGSTLALVYAEAHPERVSELVLFGVTTGRRVEADWAFRGGLATFFPQEWERLLAELPPAQRGGDVVEAFSCLLNDPDPDVHDSAAHAWCLWESASPEWPPKPGLASRFEDARFRLAFARLVTHYVRHDFWLEDGSLLEGAGALAGIPGILINGRFDFQAPLANAWALKRAWPEAELRVVDQAGHAASNERIAAELVRATDRFRADG
jgi:proline iminopeptidase